MRNETFINLDMVYKQVKRMKNLFDEACSLVWMLNFHLKHSEGGSLMGVLMDEISQPFIRMCFAIFEHYNVSLIDLSKSKSALRGINKVQDEWRKECEERTGRDFLVFLSEAEHHPHTFWGKFDMHYLRNTIADE